MIPRCSRSGFEVINDWSIGPSRSRLVLFAPRRLPALSLADAVAEVERAAELGFHAAFFPVAPPAIQAPYQLDDWDPVWSAMEAAEMVVSFRIGTEPHDASGANGLYYRGPGGAILNYYETTFGGQRATAASSRVRRPRAPPGAAVDRVRRAGRRGVLSWLTDSTKATAKFRRW